MSATKFLFRNAWGALSLLGIEVVWLVKVSQFPVWETWQDDTFTSYHVIVSLSHLWQTRITETLSSAEHAVTSCHKWSDFWQLLTTWGQNTLYFLFQVLAWLPDDKWENVLEFRWFAVYSITAAEAPKSVTATPFYISTRFRWQVVKLDFHFTSFWRLLPLYHRDQRWAQGEWVKQSNRQSAQPYCPARYCPTHYV